MLPGCALALVVFSAAPGSALERGVVLFEQQELEQSEQALTSALEGERYAREDVVRLLHHLGVVHAYLGNEGEARAAFRRLLTISPSHFLPYTISPRTTTLFTEVRNQGPPPISLSLSAPERAAFGAPIQVRVDQGSDPDEEVNALEVLVRRRGSANYRSITLPPPGPGNFRLVKLEPVPRPELDGDVVLEVALVARNKKGWEVFRGPDPAAPRVVAVGLIDKPWYAQENTVWILSGTAAAAVVGTLVLAGLFWPPPEQVPVRVGFE